MTRADARAVRRPADLLATTPPPRQTSELLANLAAAVSAQTKDAREVDVRLVHAGPDGTVRTVAAAGDAARIEPSRRTSETSELRVSSIDWLIVTPTPPPSPAWDRLLAETVAWLAAVADSATAESDNVMARRQESTAHARLDAARARRARVLELERSRLVQSVTTAALSDLAEVRKMLEQDETPWGRIQATLARATEELRATVRGVFPAMLPEAGAAAALSEFAGTLAGQVRFSGSLGRRAGWEVESAFYHAVAAVLEQVAGGDDPVDVDVELRRAEALVARLVGRLPKRLRDAAVALQVDHERLEALGGTMTAVVRPDGIVEATVRLDLRPDAAEAPAAQRYRGGSRVHDDASAIVGALGDADRAQTALLTDLVAPPRLLVVDVQAPPASPDVQVMSASGPLDAEMARELADPYGAWGRVDAVLPADPPDDAIAAVLADGPVLFRAGTTAAAAVAFLRARGSVLAARRVLDSLAALAGRRPAELKLLAKLEQVDDLDLAAQELLDQHARCTAPRVVDEAAARLLGAESASGAERLGLPADSPPSSVRDEAAYVAGSWSLTAERPELDEASRAAAAVLAQCAARLAR